MGDMFLVGWCLSIIVGIMLGFIKGRPIAGFWLALLLGPIGWIIISVMSQKRNRTESHYESSGGGGISRAVLKSKSSHTNKKTVLKSKSTGAQE
jgi:hypothetical protein